MEAADHSRLDANDKDATKSLEHQKAGRKAENEKKRELKRRQIEDEDRTSRGKKILGEAQDRRHCPCSEQQQRHYHHNHHHHHTCCETLLT